MSSKADSKPHQSHKISLVLEGIQLQFDTQELKKRILNCQKSSITDWKDDNGLDLLHHCVLENNLLACILFLSQGFFKPPHEPTNWPYMHLVACLGHTSFTSTIVQELRFRNDAILCDWNMYKHAIKPKVEKYSPEFPDTETSRRHTAIDIAALFGHIDCVKLLLDFWQLQNNAQNNARRNKFFTSKSKPTITNSSYLTLACEANSPNTVRLLLTEPQTDKKEALESAIRMGMPECVDVVLREGGAQNIKEAFQGMNLYHVLYSYRSLRKLSQYEAMIEITSVLVRHNQNVNSCRPSRTFPLYSLLSHVPATESLDKCSPHLLAALLVLMSAGADPNVDEILMEEKLKDAEQCTAFGRRPYCSAVHCFLCTLPSLKGGPYVLQSVRESADQYAYKCIEILLRHGADLGICGKFNERSFYDDELEGSYHEGSALHVIATTRAKTFISYPTLRLLLRYGIDADAVGKWLNPKLSMHVKYALNILPLSAWTLSEEKICVFSDDDLKMFKYVMKFMSQTSLLQAYQEFLTLSEELMSSEKTERASSTNSNSNDNKFDMKMYETIIAEYDQEIRNPWCLQRSCAKVIWRSCRMHMGNVFDLPIPSPLRRIILNFH